MEEIKFEAALAELETIVKRMEGDIPLDAAMEAFNKGIDLCRFCMESLKTEKGKLEILTDDLNKLAEEFKFD